MKKIKLYDLSLDKLEISKIMIDELITSYSDICVIVPRSMMFYSWWLLSNEKGKYKKELCIIKKHIDLQKRYCYINYKKDMVGNYIIPLDEAKVIIGTIKNDILLKQIDIVNILKSDFERFAVDINEEFFKLENIKALNGKEEERPLLKNKKK